MAASIPRRRARRRLTRRRATLHLRAGVDTYMSPPTSLWTQVSSHRIPSHPLPSPPLILSLFERSVKIRRSLLHSAAAAHVTYLLLALVVGHCQLCQPLPRAIQA